MFTGFCSSLDIHAKAMARVPNAVTREQSKFGWKLLTAVLMTFAVALVLSLSIRFGVIPDDLGALPF